MKNIRGRCEHEKFDGNSDVSGAPHGGACANDHRAGALPARGAQAQPHGRAGRRRRGRRRWGRRVGRRQERRGHRRADRRRRRLRLQQAHPRPLLPAPVLRSPTTALQRRRLQRTLTKASDAATAATVHIEAIERPASHTAGAARKVCGRRGEGRPPAPGGFTASRRW